MIKGNIFLISFVLIRADQFNLLNPCAISYQERFFLKNSRSSITV